MSLINRISGGLLYEEDFSSPTLNSMWQVSPSDKNRYSLTERTGFLRMKHGEPSLFLLLDAPRHDYIFEIDTEYRPVRETDTGGIVMFRDRDTRVEMLEYYDSDNASLNNWNRIRFTKRGALVEGLGSNNNGQTWELIGVANFDAPRVGMVLHGDNDPGSVPLDVRHLRLYRDTSIHLGNLVVGMEGRIIDGQGNTLSAARCEEDKDHVKLDLSSQTFPLTAKVQILDVSGFVLDETEIHQDLWGGDVFWYGVTLDLEVDGVHLRMDREYQLGNMEAGAIERRGFIINNNDIPVYNVRASIQSYSEYYGWEWADIAPELFSEAGQYRKELHVGDIMPGQRIPVWLKVTRRPYHQIASLQDYKFRIMIESG